MLFVCECVCVCTCVCLCIFVCRTECQLRGQQCPISLDMRKKHGTDLCIYVLNEVIDRHRSLNGSMFTCFRCF